MTHLRNSRALQFQLQNWNSSGRTLVLQKERKGIKFPSVTLTPTTLEYLISWWAFKMCVVCWCLLNYWYEVKQIIKTNYMAIIQSCSVHSFLVHSHHQSFLCMNSDWESFLMTCFLSWHTFDCSKECRTEEAVFDPQSQRRECNGMMNGAAAWSSRAHIVMPGVKRFSRQLCL